MAPRLDSHRFTPFTQTLGSCLLLSAVALLQGSCAQTPRPASSAESQGVSEEKPPLALEGESGLSSTNESPRVVGDLWVHRFSGSFRDDDVILREEVLSIEEGLLTIHFTLEEGDLKTELLVEMNAMSEKVVRVATILEGRPVPGEIADFEHMMAKTVFIPDQNEGRLSQKSETCLVGKTELDCEISEYKILVGDEEAMLSVARNGALQRDIAGEITAVDGTVLYHAELIEMQKGRVAPNDEESVALNK